MTTAEMTDRTVTQELEIIRRKSRGILRPAAVVDFARDPDTALHARFVWDDDQAAELWRLHQARNLIRVMVTVLPGYTGTVRAYVSLYDDREGDGGGYRTTASVMTNPTMRAALLADATEEMRLFKAKYRMLTELAEVSAAMDKVEV